MSMPEVAHKITCNCCHRTKQHYNFSHRFQSNPRDRDECDSCFDKRKAGKMPSGGESRKDRSAVRKKLYCG
jgi:hypothetical protein